MENLLGSLGPQITALMARALSLDKKRQGSCNLVLEDANAAAILELTKEKLAGQVVAGNYYYEFYPDHFKMSKDWLTICDPDG